MTRLVNARLASLLNRKTVQHSYGDRAYLLINVPTGAYDTYNNAVVTVSQVPIDCSFTDKPSAEKWKAYIDIQELVAEIRFSRPEPHKGYKVKIVARFEQPSYEDQTFEIFGIQDRGTFGYLCALRAVKL